MPTCKQKQAPESGLALATPTSNRSYSSISLLHYFSMPTLQLLSFPSSPVNFTRRSADRSQRLQGLWNDNKEKSGMWSQVMGLWICKAACKWNFPGSQRVKRSVGRPLLQKFQSLFTAWPTREECKCQR